MKKCLPLLLFTILFTQATFAQLIGNQTRANFGIEADLMANFFNNANTQAVDDWFPNTTFSATATGKFMIDTSGAAALIASYAVPANRMKSFFKLMKPAPYSLQNNRLVLDGIFHRDFHADDSTVFASGSNKNGMSPAMWTCPVSQNIPDKNDILDAMVHVRRAGPNVTDSLWMFSALSIENITGSRYSDFELYQTDISYDRTTRTFQGYGPDAGHTSWKFGPGGVITSPGDIIFTTEFGNSTTIEARIWINKADLSITPATFNWGGAFDGDGNGATFGYANIVPKTAGAFYIGTQNSVATNSGTFQVVREDNTLSTTYVAKQFMEFAVNLTMLGIEPSNFSNNPCGSPFRRVLIKTRASTSFTAELKDFIAPFRLFDYPKVDGQAYVRYFCKTMPVTNIDVVNPIPTSTYTWSTSNGHIVGSNVGTTIWVDKPGTYWVTQQLHPDCPMMAMDSVNILFDSVCKTLPVNLINFTAARQDKNAYLRWTVDDNAQVAGFRVEYCYDNVHFLPLAYVKADGREGNAEYTLLKPFEDALAPRIYYRVVMEGKNELQKFSPTVLLKLNNNVFYKPVIYPNPVTTEAWVNLESTENTTIDIIISDTYGRLISKQTKDVKKGYNHLAIPEIASQLPGMYIVKIKSGDQESAQKIIVN